MRPWWSDLEGVTASRTVTLFGEHSGSSRQPFALALSALAHCGIAALVSFGILYAPHIDTHASQTMLMRQIDLHPPKLIAPTLKSASTPRPPAAALPRKIAAHPAPGKTSPSLAAIKAAHVPIGPQTLIQPDVAEHLALKEQIPVPRMIVWKPRVTLAKKIAVPKPAPVPVSPAKPSLQAPNQEINVSDVELSSSPIPQEKLQAMPSTTSPVVVNGPIQEELPPSTVAQVDEQPTPAAVMSLSNLTMQGTANLPPVNETAKASSAGLGAGKGTGQGKASGSGAPAGSAAVQSAGAPQAGAGAGQSARTSTQITLPRTGQYSSVVFGNSLQYDYPEIAGVWHGRMAYTVYLHVGLAQSWILQYSLPANAAINFSSGTNADGGQVKLDPPWPYSILRPNIIPGSIAADALMVHGFVNTAGRFESLSIAFPESFTQAAFVLRSLARWQFRPAMANGQIARVEVLLIIPQQMQ